MTRQKQSFVGAETFYERFSSTFLWLKLVETFRVRLKNFEYANTDVVAEFIYIKALFRMCLKNSLIRNFGRRSAISASQGST